MMKQILSKKRITGLFVAASLPFAAVAATTPVPDEVDSTCYAKKTTKKPAPKKTKKP